MAKRGRPRKQAETRHFRIHLSLTVGIDDALIAYLDSIPRGGRARAVMGLCQGSTELPRIPTEQEQVDQAMDELESLFDHFS